MTAEPRVYDARFWDASAVPADHLFGHSSVIVRFDELFPFFSQLPVGVTEDILQRMAAAERAVRGESGLDEAVAGLRANMAAAPLVADVSGIEAEAVARRLAVRWLETILIAPYLDSPERLGELLDVAETAIRFDAVCSGGTPVLLAPFHLGSHQVAVPLLAAACGRELGLITPATPAGMAPAGGSLPLTVIFVGDRLALYKADRLLRRGTPVAIYPEFNLGVRSSDVPIELLGTTVFVSPGIVRLARRTGAVIVPLVCSRPDGGRFSFEFGEPSAVGDEPDETCLARLFALLEQRILADRGVTWDGWPYFRQMMHP